MIRSYHTLACALLGIVATVLVERGLDLYVLMLLALAVPWDKLVHITESLTAEYMEWRRNQKMQQELEAALR